MTDRERTADDMLRRLDEAHRTGRISQADYRARRRQVLSALCDSTGITARNALAPARAPTSSKAGIGTAAATGNQSLGVLFSDRRQWILKRALVVLAIILIGAVLALAMS